MKRAPPANDFETEGKGQGRCCYGDGDGGVASVVRPASMQSCQDEASDGAGADDELEGARRVDLSARTSLASVELHRLVTFRTVSDGCAEMKPEAGTVRAAPAHERVVLETPPTSQPHGANTDDRVSMPITVSTPTR